MANTGTVKHGITLLTNDDVYLFRQGTHARLYEKLGAHALTIDGEFGTLFAVWAPNAQFVSVIGDFNDWIADTHRLQIRQDGSGIWEGFIPGLLPGSLYKYRIISRQHDYQVDKGIDFISHEYQADKGDPFAFFWETPPKTASRIWELDYHWNDKAWMDRRITINNLNAPISIYEVHLGSWRRIVEENDRSPTYRELAIWLPEYVRDMGFTHVEFLPVTEHPFYGSWGYQTTGYFAPTARYGTPQDFMYLVDCLHQHNIGVILDWVPSHFPDDVHGIRYFDGTYLFEHADPKRGYHPEWQSYIFNYGRHEVRAFLISSALFWLDKYHIDGLRVDAVASMLYLDYGRRQGEWVPNPHGGNEDLEAVNFLRDLNRAVYRDYPGVQTIAEESTAWPAVSRPTYVGGLGFGMKWNMGWMHDTLKYFSKEPIYRKHHHDQITFSLWYAFNENFILPFSHDEIVHGKGALIGKMPGDNWQKFANLRVLYGYMYGHPGKKLLFMGDELAQWNEWNHDGSLDWHLLECAPHRGINNWLKDLNNFYRNEPALFEQDFVAEGFAWVDSHDWEESMLSFLRIAKSNNDIILVVCNFTPVPRTNYRVGVPRGGWWHEKLNSDAKDYGGSGYGNLGSVEAAPVSAHGKTHSLVLNLPPLATLFFKAEA